MRRTTSVVSITKSVQNEIEKQKQRLNSGPVVHKVDGFKKDDYLEYRYSRARMILARNKYRDKLIFLLKTPKQRKIANETIWKILKSKKKLDENTLLEIENAFGYGD